MTSSTSSTHRATRRDDAIKVHLPLTHGQIAKWAYRIWERKGRPEGQAVQHWLAAEARLKELAGVGPATGPRRM